MLVATNDVDLFMQPKTWKYSRACQKIVIACVRLVPLFLPPDASVRCCNGNELESGAKDKAYASPRGGKALVVCIFRLRFAGQHGSCVCLRVLVMHTTPFWWHWMP